MRWKMILGTMVAVGAVASTQVRAQEKPAASEAAAPAQQGGASGNSTAGGYGTYVAGPATVDANGVPVAKPNPMSRFEKRSREFGNSPIQTPLLDDPRADGAAGDQQTK
jgi:hypothetical protein